MPTSPAFVTGSDVVTRLISLAVFLLPAFALGDDAIDKPAELTVKPLLCIVDERNPGCDMTFRIRWRSKEIGYYCVFNSFEDDPLNCWSEQRAGEMSDARSIRENLVFWLSQNGSSPLDSVTVEVLRMDSGDRRRRRRSRHVWDIL